MMFIDGYCMLIYYIPNKLETKMSDLIENSEFGAFCEKIWKDWIVQGKDAFTNHTDEHSFQLDFAPEPYLMFGEDGDDLDALYVLTTNPGGAIPVQAHDYILHGKSVISSQMPYSMVSRKFAEFYLNDSAINSNAKKRIDKILRLANMIGKSRVIQIESCPFHSPDFPAKSHFIKTTQDNDFYKEYNKKLKSFLSDKVVLIVSAASSQKSLSLESISNSTWLKWQANLISFDLQNSDFIKIVEKEGKTTSGLAISHHGDDKKSIFLTMGSNNLPSSDGLKTLAEHMKY